MPLQAGGTACGGAGGDVVSGWQNKLQTAIASVTPAEQHRKMAGPGFAGGQIRALLSVAGASSAFGPSGK